ncbi:MAG TPA: hypothetical protein VL051_12090 [Burkholderiaceae bacterium]|nr:hypothetical protein [Burkholderiaceae bacterium]
MLVTLQILTPFLHAHIGGAPKLNGWRLHAQQNTVQPEQRPAQLPALTTNRAADAAYAGEPPEIGVQHGIWADQTELPLFVASSLALLAILNFFLPLRSRSHPLPRLLFRAVRRRFECAGSPPPALAPPAHS